MSSMYRCKKCYAYKKTVMEVCPYCGFDPKELDPLFGFGEFVLETHQEEMIEKDYINLSLDEKIERARKKLKR